MSSNDSTDPTPTPSTEVQTYSGNFTPAMGTDPETAVDAFMLPLANSDATKQVIGQGTNVYMPGQLRKYIPTLYQQLHINTRALLSINGYEVLTGVADETTGETKSAVTSDIRNTLLSGDFNEYSTNTLESNEVGMTKLVISQSHTSTGLRKLTCVDGAKFLVHEQLYDTYYFSEQGESLEYVQAIQQADQVAAGATPLTIYMVVHYGGYFTNAKDASGATITQTPPSNSELFIADSNGVTPHDNNVAAAEAAAGN